MSKILEDITVKQTAIIFAILLAVLGGQNGGRKINLGHVIAIAFGVMVYLFLSGNKRDRYAQFKQKTDKNLLLLDPNNEFPYLFSDDTIMGIITTALPLRQESEDIFYDLVSSLNGYLEINAAIHCKSTINPAGQYESLNRFASKSVNRFHALVYSPHLKTSSAYLILYQKSLDNLRIYLNERLKEVRQFLRHKQVNEPVNIQTIFIPSSLAPGPFQNSTDGLTHIENNFEFFD